MKKYLFIAIAFLFLLSGGAVAQPYIDLVNVKYFHLPERTDFTVKDQQVTVAWMTATLEAPVKIKNDYLVIRSFFEQYKFEHADKADFYLYGISLPLTYLKQWNNEPWKTAFTVIPRISSDFENVSANNYQLGGAVLAIYKKRENLKYKFGAYYNGEYFGAFFLPLLGIDWRINDRLALFGILPTSMTLEYKANQHIYSGMTFQSVTNSYRLYSGDWFKVQDNHLKLFADYYVTNMLVINAEAGYSVLRKYSYGIGNGTNGIKVDLEYHDGPVFKLGLAWRLRLDEAKGKQD